MSVATWKDVGRVIWREIKEDRVSNVAAGAAFFGMLSLFPTLLALISVYGLIADPVDVERQVNSLAALLPGPAQEVIGSRMRALAESSPNHLSFGLIGSVVVALWSASTGAKSLIEAVNVAYDEKEDRGFFRLRGLALLMAVGLIVAGVVSLFVITLLPHVFVFLGFGELGRNLAELARWPLLALAAMVGLSLLYRYAPNRKTPRWHWVSLGAAIATLLLIGASFLLSVYVSSFGNYDATYGTLTGMIALMLWMFISTLAILVGAEINAELESDAPRRDRSTASQRFEGVAGHLKSQPR